MQGAGGSSGGGGGIDGGGSGSGVATDDLHEELVEPWWNVTDRGVLTADDEREELVEPWWKTQNRLYAAKRAESGKYGLFALTPVGRPHEGVEQRWRPVLPSPRQPRRTLRERQVARAGGETDMVEPGEAQACGEQQAARAGGETDMGEPGDAQAVGEQQAAQAGGETGGGEQDGGEGYGSVLNNTAAIAGGIGGRVGGHLSPVVWSDIFGGLLWRRGGPRGGRDACGTGRL